MPDRFRTLIAPYESLPVAIYICDGQDKLQAFNIAAGVLLTKPPQLGEQLWYPDCRIFDIEGKPISNQYRPVSAALKTTHKIKYRKCRL